MTYKIRIIILLIVALSATLGCSSKVSLDRLLSSKTPYERYVSSLNQASLEQTLLGKNWLEAGKKSLYDSLYVNLPYSEIGYFADDRPSAISLRYTAQQGQSIQITLTTDYNDSIKFFLDVFTADDYIAPIVSADTLRNIQYEVEETGAHVLRLQPELLVSGAYKLQITAKATLSFPVSGKNYRAVGSFFGDPRDGGKRSHRGIDIFAPKGTPVVAAHAGIVTPKTSSGLGGKVVWLSSFKKKFNQYYAHLDSQAVTPGQRVSRGDTLGFVGNTGNARFTPPHLHFSIYAFGQGAVDPYPFVASINADEETIAVDTSFVGNEARIQSALANVRQAPTTQSAVLLTATQHTPVRVTGGTGKWYRAQLPNGTRGFIHQSLVQSLNSPINDLVITSSYQPFVTLHPKRPILQLWEGQQVAVLGVYESHWYVETTTGERLWMQPT
ncbi:MAG: peptidoglycan DD-metalloendopeptidase family protein [Tunicatimonas sp.]|uniref:peptidoglycan DD-metalloendopeptidase family protein n=1 Tax=Tunicatimonas sp. TaxID=1940096 RepID=UPI003C75613B